MDIAFGNCLSAGDFKYALILVDRATQYNWTFGLELLSSNWILLALRLFWASAGALARCFYCDCNAKLFGTAISEYLIDNQSKVVAAPAKRQLSNGLVESHRKVMVHMAQAYITEKQMTRNFRFYAITHAARMMNTILGEFKDHLALPFMLVHGIGHNIRTWTPLFSLCYSHQVKDGNDTHTKHMAHTMDGVIVGRSPMLNAVMVYNPCNRQYYKPGSYRIDSYRLPGLVYPTLRYGGGLFCSLLCDDNPPFEEKYPPGMRVERINPKTNKLLAGTVMDIPFPLNPSGDTSIPNYTILFDDGSTASIPLEQMAGIILLPPINVDDSDSTASLLPPFLRLNSKINFEHEGQYHKGFFGQRNGIYRFLFKSHVNKRKEDWSVPLPNLSTTWMDLCIKGVLLTGHISHTFLRSPTSPQLLTFDPVASFVSALNLHKKCPPTLLKVLADSHPDREVWLQSYKEEKSGLESLGTYCKLTLGKYQALREKGTPHTIPTMCVLTIKRDENLLS